jgi:hypothetical protein
MSWVLSRYGLDREAVLRHPSTFFTPIQPSGLSIPAPTVFWNMDAASGTETDVVGGIVLSDNNTVTSAAGKVGTARQFTNANSEYFNTADAAALQLGTASTLGWWFYLDSKTSFRTFFHKGTGNNTTDTEYQSLYHSGNNRLESSFLDSSSNQYFATNTLSNPSTATWYCVLVRWNGSHIATSLNGAAFVNGDAAAVYPRTTAGDFRIGSREPSSGLFMDGRIDGFTLWKGTALSDAQASAFYNGGAGAAYAGGIWA